MRSLEDLERAFDRGLNAWESGKVLTVAGRMGQKCVREVKRKTPVITGNLRRRWRSSAEKQGNDVVIILENDADYAEAVNNGHRIVSHGKTGGICWSRGSRHIGTPTCRMTCRRWQTS